MYWDITAPAEPCECEVLPPDGMTDLTVRFRSYLLMWELELNELPRGATVELVLSGALDDGTPFTAMDCVTVTGRPKTHAVVRRWGRR